MKNVLFCLCIVVFFNSCRKNHDQPALQLKGIAGYWNVSEEVHESYWDDTIISQANFIGQTIQEDDSLFTLNQSRNTYVYPWAGGGADIIALEVLPDNILFFGWQGNVGRISANYDTLTVKYLYGLERHLWYVIQIWIRNPRLTIDSLKNLHEYAAPYVNDSLSSIIVGAGDKMYKIGDTGKVVWSFQHEDFESNDYSYVDKDNIYFSTPRIAAFYAINNQSGNLKYRINLATGENLNTGSYIKDYPVVENGKLMINYEGIVKQYDAESGAVINENRLPSVTPYNINKSFYLDNKIVYIGTHYDFLAFDINTDTIKWHVQPFRYFTGSPTFGALPVVYNQEVFLAFDDGNMVVLNAADGSLKRAVKLSIGEGRIGNPIIGNGMIYFGSEDHKMYAFSLNGGQKKWEFPTGYVINCTPILIDGVLYFGSSDGNVYAVDANTGSKVWSYETKNAIFASPAFVNDVLYIGSSDGNLYALDAKNGKKIWSADLGGPVRSPSIITKSNRVVSAFSAR
jgi:outer membrane protein assembly factor BamB